MTHDLPAPELAAYDEISKLAASLWSSTTKVVGLNTEPRMFSSMLFKRMWSNHRGFTVLWNSGLRLEAAIILRCGIETAICIAANHKLKGGFLNLILADTASTIAGQIKICRNDGDIDGVKKGEAALRFVRSRLPHGQKGVKLDWETLATDGGVPQLYTQYRSLSGVSSHVTGISIIDGVEIEGEAGLSDAHLKMTARLHPMMMAGATLLASRLHADLISDTEIVRSANELILKMNGLSSEWSSLVQEMQS